jgi:hypothetical protein
MGFVLAEDSRGVEAVVEVMAIDIAELAPFD